MPNRILKESICTSEDLGKLSPMAEILFYRLIVKADDYGAYYGNVAIIKGNCFPLKSDDITCEQVQLWLRELEDAGLIFSYMGHDGREYVQFCKWSDHQQIRAKKRKFPEPDVNGYQVIADDSKCPRNPIQSNTESNTCTDAAEPPRLQKKEYGEYGWIKLTDAEYQRLLSDMGQSELDRCIQYVDESAQSSGNKNHWKDWNLVVRRCHREGWGRKPEALKPADSWPGRANIPRAY